MWQDNFLTCLDQQGQSRLTIKQYRRALAHFARWLARSYGEAFDPAAVIPRDVADWKAHQQTVERAAPATINQRLSAVPASFAGRWPPARRVPTRRPASSKSGLSSARRER